MHETNKLQEERNIYQEEFFPFQPQFFLANFYHHGHNIKTCHPPKVKKKARTKLNVCCILKLQERKRVRHKVKEKTRREEKLRSENASKNEAEERKRIQKKSNDFDSALNFEDHKEMKGLTVGFLVASTGTRTTELFGFRSASVGDEQAAVEFTKNLLEITLCLFINIYQPPNTGKDRSTQTVLMAEEKTKESEKKKKKSDQHFWK